MVGQVYGPVERLRLIDQVRNPGRDRIAPENPHAFGLAPQGVDGPGNGWVLHRSLEIDEEHVTAEPLAKRPRLDSRQVDAAVRELGQSVHESARMVLAEL